MTPLRLHGLQGACVSKIAADDSVLFLWAIDPMLPRHNVVPRGVAVLCLYCVRIRFPGLERRLAMSQDARNGDGPRASERGLKDCATARSFVPLSVHGSRTDAH
jgi:hypothetical protein